MAKLAPTQICNKTGAAARVIILLLLGSYNPGAHVERLMLAQLGRAWTFNVTERQWRA